MEIGKVHPAIFSPHELPQATQAYAETVRKVASLAIPFYIDRIDDYFTPMIGGDMLAYLSSSGNCKTSMSISHMLKRAKALVDAGLATGRACVYFSAEMTIEALYMKIAAALQGTSYRDLVKGNLTDLQFGEFKGFLVGQIGKLPIWMAGYSSTRRKASMAAMPAGLSVEFADRVLTAIETWNGDKFDIDIAYLDYLQLIKLENRNGLSKNFGKPELISGVCHGVKELGMHHNCVTWVNTQASRDAEKNNNVDKMPEKAHSQWSSDLEHDADILMTGWRPSNYYADQEKIEIEGRNFTVDEWLYLIKCWKQRQGSVNSLSEIFFDARRTRFSDRLEDLGVITRQLNG